MAVSGVTDGSEGPFLRPSVRIMRHQGERSSGRPGAHHTPNPPPHPGPAEEIATAVNLLILSYNCCGFPAEKEEEISSCGALPIGPFLHIKEYLAAGTKTNQEDLTLVKTSSTVAHTVGVELRQ